MSESYPAIAPLSQQRGEQQWQVSVQLQFAAQRRELLSVQEAGRRRVAAVELGLQLRDVAAVLRLLHANASHCGAHTWRENTGQAEYSELFMCSFGLSAETQRGQ